ncbi:MAG: AAA family ATPase [Burkholderiaceae bacterium]
MHLELAARSRARRGDADPVDLASRDAALLAWLAVEGPTPRARLAALLWPDSDGEAARNALRQRLFQLRRHLGGEAVTGHATLTLADGVTHDLESSDQLLGVQLAVVGGEFAGWLEEQRRRRRERQHRLLADRAQRAEEAGDWAAAVTHANEVLALEPLSEPVHQRLMRLHYLSGNRAAALLAFDACERVLKDEVGAQPSAATLALLATIEAAVPEPVARPGDSLPASVQRPPRLIGRDRELAAMSQGWQAGQVVALIGEAGLGKTRLLQAFVDNQPGVVRAAGRPGDAGVPFATLARLLRGVMALAGDVADGPLPPSTRSEIARVLPEFHGDGGRQAGEGQRLVLQRAVRALLANQPQLVSLVVDDLHFADEASLEMLGALIDRGDVEAGSASALNWALAYRPAEAGSPVQALHDGLVEQAQLLPVPLSPLDERALAELVDSLALPGIEGRVLAPGLLRRTGGNPLFVLETLKQAWVDRTLADLVDAGSMPRPLSVGRLIERRVAQLSPSALALARVASIAGVDFGIGLAEHVLQASAMQFADALNELESAQVLRGTQFAHDLVFDAVLASVPTAIAQHTHAAVAVYLAKAGREPARIAMHWIGSAQPRQALPWLQKAADAAGAALRNKERIVFLEQKSRIEEAGGDPGAAFASQMLAAELQVTVDGEGGHGLAQCDRLEALASDMSQRIRARVQRAHLVMMRGDASASEAIAADALRQALRGRAEAELVVECRQHLATALAQQNRSIEAVAQFEASLGWIEEHAGPERRCEFHGNIALAYDNLGRIADSLPHHEAGIALSQQLEDHSNFTMCLSNFAANRILGGRLREGEDLLQRARRSLAMADDPSSHEGFMGMLQAICDTQGGRYRDALRVLAQSDAQLARFAPGFCRMVTLYRAVCWAQLGQWGRFQQELAALGDPAQLPATLQLRLALLRYQRDRALRQRAQTVELHAALEKVGHSEVPDLQHMVRIEIAATLPPAEGLGRLDAIVADATLLGHAGTVIAAHARAAVLAAEAGDAAQARARVDAALALFAQGSMMVRQYPGELWLHCGSALAAIGDRVAAVDIVSQGRAWLQAVARDGVPEEYRDGFLHRNPVNQALHALAARLGADQGGGPGRG